MLAAEPRKRCAVTERGTRISLSSFLARCGRQMRACCAGRLAVTSPGAGQMLAGWTHWTNLTAGKIVQLPNGGELPPPGDQKRYTV